MEELGEVKIKLDVGGVVRDDTILEVEYEGLLYHYKVADVKQLQESIIDSLREFCYDFKDLWFVYKYQEGFVEINCTLITDDTKGEFCVLVPAVESAFEFYRYAFGLVVSALGYKVSYLE